MIPPHFLVKTKCGGYLMNEDVYPGLALFAGWAAADTADFFSLPEEIREGIEQRKEEIHSKEDLDRVVQEFKMKK